MAPLQKTDIVRGRIFFNFKKGYLASLIEFIYHISLHGLKVFFVNQLASLNKRADPVV